MLVQMLNCISGMVEKTQRAISILQQRQAEAGSARSAEELVADIQARASSALMEVKLAALEEIRAAKQGAADTAQPGQQSKNKDEVRLSSPEHRYQWCSCSNRHMPVQSPEDDGSALIHSDTMTSWQGDSLLGQVEQIEEAN